MFVYKTGCSCSLPWSCFGNKCSHVSDIIGPAEVVYESGNIAGWFSYRSEEAFLQIKTKEPRIRFTTPDLCMGLRNFGCRWTGERDKILCMCVSVIGKDTLMLFCP